MNLGRESEFLEFKETTNELVDAIEDISAILNKRGRGIFYFGVRNNCDVRGFDIGDPTEGTLDPMYFLGAKALPSESLETPTPPTCLEHSIF